MIQTKIFTTKIDIINGNVGADEKCNKFIKENPSINPIDFKYSSSVSRTSNSLIPTYYENILMIYESVEE